MKKVLADGGKRADEEDRLDVDLGISMQQ